MNTLAGPLMLDGTAIHLAGGRCSLYAQSTGLGLTSGGSGNCTVGGTTYFQPIAPVMQAFGFRMWDTAQP